MHENIWAERVLNAKHRLLILTSHNNWFGVSFQPTMERSSKVSPKLSAKWIHRAERVRDWLGLTHGGKPNFFASCKILNLFNTQQPSLQVPKKHANWLDSPTESEENMFVKKKQLYNETQRRRLNPKIRATLDLFTHCPAAPSSLHPKVKSRWMPRWRNPDFQPGPTHSAFNLGWCPNWSSIVGSTWIYAAGGWWRWPDGLSGCSHDFSWRILQLAMVDFSSYGWLLEATNLLLLTEIHRFGPDHWRWFSSWIWPSSMESSAPNPRPIDN